MTAIPVDVNAFEGNQAETNTMTPTVHAFREAHRPADVTVITDQVFRRRRTAGELIEAPGLRRVERRI